MYAMTNEDIVAPKTCQHVQTISRCATSLPVDL